MASTDRGSVRQNFVDQKYKWENISLLMYGVVQSQYDNYDSLRDAIVNEVRIQEGKHSYGFYLIGDMPDVSNCAGLNGYIYGFTAHILLKVLASNCYELFADVIGAMCSLYIVSEKFSKLAAYVAAAYVTDIGILSRLLELKVDMGLSTQTWSPMHMAAKSGNVAFITYALSVGVDLNIYSPYDSPLIVAVKEGMLEVAKVLISGGCPYDNSLIYHAVRSGNVELVAYLTGKSVMGLEPGKKYVTSAGKSLLTVVRESSLGNKAEMIALLESDESSANDRK